MNKSDTNTDKKLAELYFSLYKDCLKYKKEKDKKTNCDEFYKKFNFYANKYICNKYN